MGKNDKERRVYPKEFKAEAVALAEKHEKPVCRDQRKAAVPVDTAGPGNGGDRHAAVSRAWTAAG
jgi:hypothetical protein